MNDCFPKCNCIREQTRSANQMTTLIHSQFLLIDSISISMEDTSIDFVYLFFK